MLFFCPPVTDCIEYIMLYVIYTLSNIHRGSPYNLSFFIRAWLRVFFCYMQDNLSLSLSGYGCGYFCATCRAQTVTNGKNNEICCSSLFTAKKRKKEKNEAKKLELKSKIKTRLKKTRLRRWKMGKTMRSATEVHLHHYPSVRKLWPTSSWFSWYIRNLSVKNIWGHWSAPS